MRNLCHYESPIGTIRIEEENGFIVGLYTVKAPDGVADNETRTIKQAHKELQEYFAGRRQVFDVPLRTEGTEFQEKVWAALRTIPYGETRSYGDIAKQIGNPKGSRAVGGANNKNPILIMTPCHRVIGSSGALVGFGGGLDVKEYLLKLEKSL